jgi:formylglycine-generating enzyme required for sulfatase activity
MSGNIMEWCANWHYGYPLEASPEDDPCGPPTGTHRAVRGGNYCCDSNDCRASRRRHRSSPSLPETKANNSIGFRCVVDWKAVERLKAGTWKPPS